MTALEDKLRDALTATADLVTPGSIRMDDPSMTPWHQRRRRPRATPRSVDWPVPQVGTCMLAVVGRCRCRRCGLRVGCIGWSSARTERRSRSPRSTSGGEPRFTAFAVSPDGSSLAIDGSAADTTGLTAGITIVNINNGQTRTFRADRVGATATDFTWSADGRHLAYQLKEYQEYSSSPGGLRS